MCPLSFGRAQGSAHERGYHIWSKDLSLLTYKMEDEDSFLIDMPRTERQKCCDRVDCCCTIITTLIIVAVVALLIATFVFGFNPYTMK